MTRYPIADIDLTETQIDPAVIDFFKPMVKVDEVVPGEKDPFNFIPIRYRARNHLEVAVKTGMHGAELDQLLSCIGCLLPDPDGRVKVTPRYASQRQINIAMRLYFL